MASFNVAAKLQDMLTQRNCTLPMFELHLAACMECATAVQKRLERRSAHLWHLKVCGYTFMMPINC